MLNMGPNSNSATCVGNNVRLTAMGAQEFSMAATYIVIKQKSDLPEKRDNDTITIKVHADRNKLCPGREWRLFTQ